MSWSLRVWTKAFVCRLKAKLIMRENLTGKLSLDFQENISEIRKLPLSFHFPEEDVNWSEMVILVEFWPKLALYWLYCQLFSVKAKRKKKKSGWGGATTKKIHAQGFLEDNCYESQGTCTWHMPSVRGIEFAENILSQAGGRQISVLPVSLSQGQIHAHLRSLLLASLPVRSILRSWSHWSGRTDGFCFHTFY